MIFRKSLFLLIFCVLGLSSLAQSRKITGKVVSSDGNVLSGATVTVKGQQKAQLSNESGFFSIEIPSGANTILVISYVGHVNAEQIIATQSDYTIVLQKEDNSLTDVVVVGYGTQKKRDVTGAVASLPKERLTQLPNTNIAQALQGAVPGIQINTNGGGAEGNDVSIVIRGRKSISASNGPLIVWDGIPYDGGISELNPNDVESIEILKDASAAAIYGARGSNGVIIVTSKQGKKGKLNITYDGFYGTQSINNKPELLTGAEFYEFKKNRLNSPNVISPGEQAVYDAGKFVDWYDLATQTGTRSQHSISVAGGSDKVSFYLGGTFLDVKGVAINDRFKRYSLRPNLDIKVTPWLTIASSTQFSLQNRDGLPVEFQDSRNTGGGGKFLQSINYTI